MPPSRAPHPPTIRGRPRTRLGALAASALLLALSVAEPRARPIEYRARGAVMRRRLRARVQKLPGYVVIMRRPGVSRIVKPDVEFRLLVFFFIGWVGDVVSLAWGMDVR